ncbi:MAG: lamin tail domain-containing protein [Prolixibacteraceae bacterium]
MLKICITLLFLSLLFTNGHSQLLINEASNRNYSQVSDEDGEFNDWIEIYNSGNETINLKGWALSDSRKDLQKWLFASNPIQANSFVLVNASGKDRNQFTESLQWESAVLPGNEFRYLVPDETSSSEWFQSDFDDAVWESGKAGFGYGDDDDVTIVPEGTRVVFIRKEFIVEDPSVILSSKLHVDYDDGFVAYLNGIEIARSNFNGTPQWNSFANGNHEAVIYEGATPEEFVIDETLISSALKTGKNVLAIAGINIGDDSSDMTLIPFLSFGLDGAGGLFQPVPAWFIQTPPGNLHTSFKISSGGEKIYLSNAGILVDSIDVDGLQRDQSIGRVKDGTAQTGIFILATPGTSNNSSQAYTNGFSTKPKMSLPAGFYSSSIEISLSIDKTETTIRYTLDGSEPTITSSLYTVPIKISSTKCIRARSFSDNLLPSKIVTSTYFINDEYSLPVLSVTANRADIFGSQGIFTNWNETFEIPAYIEYFEKDKKLAFHQLAGMQIDGGAGGSRSLPQHSFRMEPGNGALGDGDLNYRLMPRRPNRTNFPSFYVRNGSNQHLVLPYKDGLEVTALGRNTYTYYSAYHPIAVYINAEFFGIYELREKINNDYLVDNYQMDIDSLDFLGVSYFKGQQLEALRGSVQPFLDDYQKFLGMSTTDEDYLKDVDEFLDVQSYTDYIIAESWVGNNDWPFNNIKLFRCSSTGFRWQWAINDLEWALNPNGWTTSNFDHIQYMLNQGTGNSYTGFWFNMMKNTDYKAYFVNRFADLMNTTYDFSVIGALENELFDEIYPEMDKEYDRWGSSNITSQMNTFSNNHEIFRSELSVRSGFVRDDLQSHFNLQRKVNVTLDVEPKGAGSIQISTITPTQYPWKGIYFGNVEIQVKAIANLGYEFVSWDPTTFIEDISNEVVTGVFKSTNARFTANFKEAESANSGVVVSEINYKSGVGQYTPDWIEICNFNNQEVNMKGWSFTDSDTAHTFNISQDLILTAKQRIVICNDLGLFEFSYPGVAVYPVAFDFGLGAPNDAVNLYNSNKEMVFSVQYSDNYPWALSYDDSGRTLELRSSGVNYSESGNWFRGCIGGSPGTPYQFCDEPEEVAVPLVELNGLDLKVYPNPARNFIEVAFQLDEELEFCQLSVYSLMGNEIRSEELGSLSPGQHQFNFDLEGIPSQLLLVKIRTNRSERLVKVLKVD